MNSEIDGKVKKFSKIRFLQVIGFLDRKLNPETWKLERSLPLLLYGYLCLILKLTHCSRLFVCLFWSREDPKQIMVGSLFNYLDDEPR